MMQKAPRVGHVSRGIFALKKDGMVVALSQLKLCICGPVMARKRHSKASTFVSSHILEKAMASVTSSTPILWILDESS
jgi:hypothetical protein